MPITRWWQRELNQSRPAPQLAKDGEPVPDYETELEKKLRLSVQRTCKHPASERLVNTRRMPDNGEEIEYHFCDLCELEWEIFEGEAS